jgi:hypothetical protein
VDLVEAQLSDSGNNTGNNKKFVCFFPTEILSLYGGDVSIDIRIENNFVDVYLKDAS